MPLIQKQDMNMRDCCHTLLGAQKGANLLDFGAHTPPVVQHLKMDNTMSKCLYNLSYANCSTVYGPFMAGGSQKLQSWCP
jgi:hypothetical protein